MQPDFNAAPQAAKQWPDFYSILNSTPETDADTLRKTINKMYVQANTELDHRELSRRFYYQVLSQKVLPQCRRVLLDKEVRTAYDEQWMLHRDGVAGALSYSEFITGLSKKLNVDTSTLLTDSELAVLPSFEHGASVSVPSESVSVSPKPAQPASVVAAASAVESLTAPKPSPAPVTSAPTSDSVTSVPALAAKKSNLPLLGGLAALGVAVAAGGAMWNSSRQADDEGAAPITGMGRATTRVQTAPVAQPVTTETTLRSPIVLHFDSMPGKIEGNVKIGPGLDGQGLVLSGSGGVELPQTLDTSKSYTVMTWVKLAETPVSQTNPSPFKTFISADGPLQSAFFLQLRGDTQRFGFASLPINNAPLATFAGASSSYKLNTWYHLAGVYDAPRQKMSLYVNGALENSVTYAQAYRGAGTIRLGRAKFDGKAVDFMTGTLDEMRILQKVVSGPEILAIVKPLKAKAGIK